MEGMTDKRKTGNYLLALMVVLAVAVGCFCLGKGIADSRWNEEKEKTILLNKSELDGLGEMSGTIYVTGHKSPDSDTVGSAIAYANLLCTLGYEAKAVVLGDLNNETRYILDAAGMDCPELMENAAGCNMALVDHSEYTQSADGLQDARILSIIDHHADGTVTTSEQLIYDARPLGATTTVVWMRYQNYGVTPDQKTALVMMGAILSDTKNLKSGNTTYADREAVSQLKEIAGVKDVEAFYQDMFIASLSYEGMSGEEILFSDYKEYEKGGVKFSIGNINAYDETAVAELAKQMQEVFPSALASTGMDMIFAQINVFHDDLSFTYLIPADDLSEQVLQKAFPDSRKTEGTGYRLEPCASRKKDVVPAITKVLETDFAQSGEE